MTGRTPAWRAALRLARRDALRAKGRTALVALMIGLPVLAVSTADVLVRSSDLSGADRADVALGPTAQAEVQVVYDGSPLEQSPDGEGFGTDEPAPGDAVEEPAEPLTVEGARSLVGSELPAGSTLAQRREGAITLRVGDRAVQAIGVELDTSSGLTGPYRLEEGRVAMAAGEAAITTSLARHAGLEIGDTLAVTLPEGAAATDDLEVVGVLLTPSFNREVVVPPQTIFGDADGEPVAGATSTGWYVVGRAEVSWPDVLRLNEVGALVVSRAVLDDPPPDIDVPLYGFQEMGNTGESSEAVAVALVVVGLALLEVALLAGPAFAVGARRNRRQLALVAAGGGDRRHVRCVVLAGGVVIGLGASVAGAAGGVAVAAVARPLLQRFELAYLPTLHVRPLDLVALVAVGTGTAIAAAVLPAVQASRQDVVAALAGRQGQRRVRRWVPVTGAVVAAAGAALAVAGAVTRQPLVVLSSAALAELGLVATTGALVAGLARFSRPMPVSARIAVRDAARQRSRTAPAVAAVMTAVAGSVAVSMYLVAQDSRAEEGYVASAPMGSVMWAGYADPLTAGSAARLPQETARAADVLRAELPVTDLHVLQTLQSGTAGQGVGASAEVPPERLCPISDDPDPTAAEIEAEREATSADPRCQGGYFYNGEFSFGSVVVDDGAGAAALTSTDTDAVRAALAAGSAVVGGPEYLWDDGTAHVTVERYDLMGSGPADTEELVVPAVAADLHGTELVLPPSAVPETGLEIVASAVLAASDVVPTEAEAERATAALADAGMTDTYVYVERGFTSDSGLVLLVLAAAAGLITLGATGIAVGLAAADSRADLATLAAVGASPQVRRRVAGAQAAVVSVLGVLLGVLAGAVLGAVVVLMNRFPALGFDPTWVIVVPWAQLGALVVGVPALAIAAGYAFTRSRLPMVRRVGQ